MPEYSDEEARIILEYIKNLKAYLQNAVRAASRIERALQPRGPEPDSKPVRKPKP